MRKACFSLCFLASIPLQASCYWCLDYSITTQLDYGYLRRSEIRNLRLVEDTARVKGSGRFKKVMSTEDLVDRMNWESAIRAGLTYHRNDKTSLEALYTYFFPWKGTKTVTADGSLQFPFIDPVFSEDYTGADKARAEYESWLQNAELNYWGHLTPSRANYFAFAWILGFRFLYLKEDFDLKFSKVGSSSLYAIETKNLLYGAQLGATLEINPSKRWTWTFQIKGAGFLNVAETDLCIGDENNTIVLKEFTKERWTDSYLLEGYGQLAYHWRRNFSVHFGYQGFILTGIALAPEQRDVKLKDRRRVHAKGQIVIDGLYAGLEYSF